jgi:hypothetical protein
MPLRCRSETPPRDLWQIGRRRDLAHANLHSSIIMAATDHPIKKFVRSLRGYTLFERSARWTIAFGVFSVLAIPASELLRNVGVGLIPFEVFVACLVVAGCAAGLTIFLGMFADLLLNDHSPRKLLWATVFLLTAWFGSTVYFYGVYRKQMPHRPRP